MNTPSFDNQKYLDLQTQAFKSRLSEAKGPIFIEFGGKPFDDRHASRVLPGYNPDNKAHILKALNPFVQIVMVVNAKDILPPPYGRTLKGRIRGDSGLRYDSETIRLVERARKLGFKINKVVISVTPITQDSVVLNKIEEFRQRLNKIGARLIIHYENSSYPDENLLDKVGEPFSRDEQILKPNESLIVFSPGGGSGKFGVVLSEIYHSLKRDENPSFIKFETFPVFHLDANHPLNLAYESATADLGNKVISLGTNLSNYNKDIENFRLLKKTFSLFKIGKNSINQMESPLDMGINRIETGIIDMKLVTKACREEIIRRITRYEAEVSTGDEKISTLERAKEILTKFDNLYPYVR